MKKQQSSSEEFSILPVSEEDIHVAFEKRWNDFEDCVQYVIALNNHMEFIVSANTKDFEETELEVLTLDSFLENYRMV